MWDELIEQQAGVVSRRQALAAGNTPSAIRANLDAGRWVAVHQGIYRTFTGEMPRRARLWAALLRAGAGAALSHDTAAELHGLVDQPSDPIHITIPATRRVRPIDGVVVHHSARLAAATQPARTPRRTTIEDTVLDLAVTARRQQSAIGWLTQACGRRLTTPERLRDALGRRRKVRWRRLLSAVVDDTSDGCHSVLERRYLHDVERRHHLPRGRRQAAHVVGGRTQRRDVLYEDFDTTVELDGRAYHPEERRRADRARDNAAAASGLRTLRYGWGDIDSPCVVALQVGQVLRAGGWLGRVRRCRRRNCQVRSTVIRKTPGRSNDKKSSGS